MWINGTIFIKKEMKYNIKADVLTGDFNNLRPVTPEELEIIKLNNPGLFEEKTAVNIDEDFWILFITNHKIFMHNHNLGTFEEYNSLEEVAQRFIPLEYFLQQASYLGKKLVIPAGSEIIKNGKQIFSTKQIPEYIILYLLNDVLIVKELKGNQEYRLISRFNPKFRKYEIDHEIDLEYSNKEQIFQAIVSQIYNKNKKDYQERQR